MKQCPKCKRAYSDETLNFCLDDGVWLAADDGGVEAATAVFGDRAPAAELPTRIMGSASGAALSDASPGRANSIAVLPFANISADPENEYFCDGLAEELLNVLAKMDDLKVAARTSAFFFKGKNLPVSEVGRALNVNTVLEGGVRKSGNRVRISSQLIKASDGYHLWSETYDREIRDIFGVQEEIALAIVDALKMKLVGGERAAVLKRPTDDPRAYQLYLKGRYNWNKYTGEGARKSIEFFKQAIEIDPGYALAYAGLADGYVQLIQHAAAPLSETFPKARAAALKALEIDESLAEGYSALGMIKTFYEWDWEGAERELRRAVELNPNNSIAYQYLGIYHCVNGRFDESLAAFRQAHDLDPLSVGISEGLGWPFYYSRQYGQAIEQFQKTLEMEPDFENTRCRIGLAYMGKGMYEGAAEEFKKAYSMGGDPDGLAWLGHMYGITGRLDEARKVLAELLERSQQVYVPPYDFAVVHAGLGEKDEAFEWLEKGAENHDYWLMFVKFDPMLDSLRDDARFAGLLRRVGLPQ